MRSEEWKDIVGHEGRYQVSNLGNVRSSLRRPQGVQFTAKSISTFGDRRVVYLSTEGKSKRTRVDHLVWQAFNETEHDKEEMGIPTTSCPCVDEEVTGIILALKEIGPVVDFNDTKQALSAYSLLKGLLTTTGVRR